MAATNADADSTVWATAMVLNCIASVGPDMIAGPRRIPHREYEPDKSVETDT